MLKAFAKSICSIPRSVTSLSRYRAATLRMACTPASAPALTLTPTCPLRRRTFAPRSLIARSDARTLPATRRRISPHAMGLMPPDFLTNGTSHLFDVD
ncbi:hypothetical protein DIPPA_18908 [Diplonema papillatum]|nr:hypothetical protein DIPPA_17567 [Diplonema papillatum]KAJ9441395.1 hypothetical protein DIPPA_18908 [Diplonema papillatum]